MTGLSDSPSEETTVVVEVDSALGGVQIRPRAGATGRRIADLVLEGEEDPRVVLRQLVSNVSIGNRVTSAAHRMNLSSDDAVALLERLALQTPHDTGATDSGLTEAEESVLREAGSLSAAELPFSERASTMTTQQMYGILKESLTVREAADRLGVTDSRIRQRLADHTLMGIQDGGSWRIPLFQFADDKELRGLSELIRAFPDDVHPVAVAFFLDRPQVDLEIDGTPVSPKLWLLSGGDVGRVVDLVGAAYEYP